MRGNNNRFEIKEFAVVRLRIPITIYYNIVELHIILYRRVVKNNNNNCYSLQLNLVMYCFLYIPRRFAVLNVLSD